MICIGIGFVFACSRTEWRLKRHLFLRSKPPYNFQNIGWSKLKLTDWQLIEDTNSAEIVSDPYRRTQQDKEMDKAHFLLDLKTRTLIRIPRT